MIKDFKKATDQLKELVEVLNSIKSEAVQLKLVDFMLEQDFTEETTPIVEVAPVVEPVQESIPEIKAVKEKKVKKEKKAKKEKKEKKEKQEEMVTMEEVEKPTEAVEPEVVKPKTKGRPRKEKKEEPDKVKVSKKRIPNRPGPSIILNQLLEDNYFTDNRTIGQIVEQCDAQYHYKYKSTDLSGTLAKLAKDGILSRSKNPTNNQFEYIKS